MFIHYRYTQKLNLFLETRRIEIFGLIHRIINKRLISKIYYLKNKNFKTSENIFQWLAYHLTAVYHPMS